MRNAKDLRDDMRSLVEFNGMSFVRPLLSSDQDRFGTVHLIREYPQVMDEGEQC